MKSKNGIIMSWKADSLIRNISPPPLQVSPLKRELTIFKRNKAINFRSDSLEKQSRWQSTRSICNSFVNSIHLKSTMQKPSMNSICEEPSRNGSMIFKPQKFKKLSSVARSISPLNNDLLVSTSNNFDFSISPIKLRVSNLKECLLLYKHIPLGRRI